MSRSHTCPIRVSLFAAAALLLASSAQAVTPPQKCESGKNSTVGKYAACLHKAQQKFVNGGSVDLLSRAAAEAICAAKLGGKWSTLESQAGLGICPSEGDETEVLDFVDACVGAVEDHLAGGTLPVDVETCNEQLDDVGVMRTGATQCSDQTGTIIPCAGTGQDAAYQAGVAASYTDNGDGTVTDNISGLMWEKLTDDGSIHDGDNLYTWVNTFNTKVATLNSMNFAGYNDWRIPNIKEMQSIINFGTTNPATYSAFYNNCMPGCNGIACACFPIQSYWTSTTVNTGQSAWVVYFSEGRTIFTLKSGSFATRAVRGGL